MILKQESIQHRFEKLDGERSAHLQRQRDCAALTIPALLPPVGTDDNTSLSTPWQSLGAKGVNNLASKLLLTLLPSGGSFFRYEPASHIEDEIEQRQAAGEEISKSDLEVALGEMERKISKGIEQAHIRVPVFRMLKLLIVTGNSLIMFPDDGGMKVYRLDQYVVQRDKAGNVIEIITKEEVSPVTLPQDLLDQIDVEEENRDKNLPLYTRVVRTSANWEVSQEIKTVPVEASRGTYSLDNCPWVVLRWSDSDGGHYGRGLCDENLGDLRALESLTQTIIEGSAAMAKMLFLVNPNGVTSYKALAEAPNTGFVSGKFDDVGCLQAQKHADFQVAQQSRQELVERLSAAFLMNSSVQRRADRVTAEEIRFMASELEDALGGVYSLLSQEFQIPLVKRFYSVMVSKKEIPPLPKGSVNPVIVTGIEALGRGHDLNKLNSFMQNISVLGPDVIKQYLVVGDYFKRTATALGMDTDGLIRTEEEVQQQVQQQMAMQAMQQIGTDGAKTLMGSAGKMAENEHAAGMSAEPQPQA